MSLSGAFNLHPLDERAQSVRPARKRAAKLTASRLARRQGKVETLQALADSAKGEILATLAAQVEAKAHAFAVGQEAFQEAWDEFMAQRGFELGEAFQKPLSHDVDYDEPLDVDYDYDPDEPWLEAEAPTELVGGLPDWMLARLETEGRSAFDHLADFEAPTGRRRPVFLED